MAQGSHRSRKGLRAGSPQREDLSLVPSADDVPLSSGKRGEELVVRISADGHIEFTGSRADVEAFLEELAAEGLVLELRFLSWCG